MNKPFVPDIDVANIYLEAAVMHCIFRINNTCEIRCAAQDYCKPKENGLRLVTDIKDND